MTKKYTAQVRKVMDWDSFSEQYEIEDYLSELNYAGKKVLVSWDEDGVVSVISKVGRKMPKRKDKFISSKILKNCVVEGILQDDGYFIVTDILVEGGTDIREAPLSFRKDKNSDFAKKVASAYPTEYGDRIGFPKMFDCCLSNLKEVEDSGYFGIMCKKVNGKYIEKDEGHDNLILVEPTTHKSPKK